MRNGPFKRASPECQASYGTTYHINTAFLTHSQNLIHRPQFSNEDYTIRSGL